MATEASSSTTTAVPTAEPTEPPTSLLTLTSTLLSLILEDLPPQDLLRVLTMTSKHQTLARFAHSQAPEEEATLWTRLLRQYLSRFTPASAWFGLKEDKFSWSKPMSEQDGYKPSANLAKRRLTAVLEKAGLSGLEWVWEEEGISPVDARKLFFVPTSIPQGKNKADFETFLGLFICERCHKHGTATKQCAACGKLLCSTCATGCELQDHCPIALCATCDAANERDTFYILNEHLPPPGLITSSCSVCQEGPDPRGCHVHKDYGLIWCASCMEIRCPEHRLEPPGEISICGCTREPLCTRCLPAGRSFELCMSCFLETCDTCAEKNGGRCQNCGCSFYGSSEEEEEDSEEEEEEEEEGGEEQEEEEEQGQGGGVGTV